MAELLPGGALDRVSQTCGVGTFMAHGAAAIGRGIRCCYAGKMPRLICPLFSASLLLFGCTGQEQEIREARVGTACSDTESGNKEGQAIQDFSLLDQDGASVLLSDYCGQVVYLQFGAMWCPTCRTEAAKINGLMERYSSDGLVILNLITETPEGKVPTTEDLLAWANHFDLSVPVLGDPDWQVWDRYFPVHSTPRAMLVDRDGRIAQVDFVLSEEDLREALDLLP